MLGTEYDLPYVMQCEALHFASSALAGLLVAWWAWPWISITLYQDFQEVPTWPSWLVLLLLVAFVGALVHCFVDFILDPWLASLGLPGGF